MFLYEYHAICTKFKICINKIKRNLRERWKLSFFSSTGFSVLIYLFIIYMCIAVVCFYFCISTLWIDLCKCKFFLYFANVKNGISVNSFEREYSLRCVLLLDSIINDEWFSYSEFLTKKLSCFINSLTFDVCVKRDSTWWKVLDSNSESVLYGNEKLSNNNPQLLPLCSTIILTFCINCII